MASRSLGDNEIQKYLEELELEKACEEGFVDLGEDVTITFEEVNERTAREEGSEDEVYQEEAEGLFCFPTTPLPVTLTPTTSHVDSVASPVTSPCVDVGYTTPATGTEQEAAVHIRDTHDTQEFELQDLDELADEPLPEYSPIYILSRHTVLARNRHIWSTAPPCPRPRKRKRDHANFTPGPTEATDGFTEANTIFSLFLDDLTISRIVHFTNKFIGKIKLKFKSPRSQYDHTATIKIKALLGILIFQELRKTIGFPLKKCSVVIQEQDCIELV